MTEETITELPTLTDLSLEKCLQQYEQKQKIPTESLTILVSYTSRRRIDALNNRNYEEADKFYNQRKDLENELEKQIIAEKRKEEVARLKKRLLEEKELLKSRTEIYEQEEAELITNYDNHIKSLLEIFEQEDDQFGVEWNNIMNLKKFNKPSPTLINLRVLEKRYAAANDYRRAREVRKHADELEKVETETAQQRAINGMKTSYELQKRNHEREVEAALRKREQDLLSLRMRKEEELLSISMTIKKLEKLIKNPMLVKKTEFQPKLKFVDSFRNRSVLNDLRVGPVVTPLDIKGINFNKHIPKKQRAISVQTSRTATKKAPKKEQNF